MKKESFNEMDKSLMRDLKSAREQKVPPIYLKGFAASVERKIAGIHEKEEPVFAPKRFTVPVWVPVMAVLVIAVTLVLQGPLGTRSLSVTPQSVQLASATLSEQELSEEISVMTELGEWSDEDESLLESLEESDLEDLEYSYAGNSSQNLLA